MPIAPPDLHMPQKQSAAPVSAAPVTGEFKPATPLSVMMAPGATASPAGQHEAGRGGSAGVWLLRVSDRAVEAARCGDRVVSELVYKRGPLQVHRWALITLAAVRGYGVLWLAAIWDLATPLLNPSHKRLMLPLLPPPHPNTHIPLLCSPQPPHRAG